VEGNGATELVAGMWKLITSTSHAMRMIYGFGFAALWGYFAYTWNAMGDAGPGQATVISTAAMAAASALGGLFALRRLKAGTRAAPKVEAPRPATATQDAPAPSDFDPDAIIARYLSERAARPPESPALQAEPPPTRPVFGRKRTD